MKLLGWFKAKAIIIFAIMLVLLLLGGWFYWFQYRPAQIRRECSSLAKDTLSKMGIEVPRDITISKGSFNNLYRLCLAKNGIKPEDLIGE